MTIKSSIVLTRSSGAGDDELVASELVAAVRQRLLVVHQVDLGLHHLQRVDLHHQGRNRLIGRHLELFVAVPARVRGRVGLRRHGGVRVAGLARLARFRIHQHRPGASHDPDRALPLPHFAPVSVPLLRLRLPLFHRVPYHPGVPAARIQLAQAPFEVLLVPGVFRAERRQPGVLVEVLPVQDVQHRRRVQGSLNDEPWGGGALGTYLDGQARSSG